jgi:hypothetical protein
VDTLRHWLRPASEATEAGGPLVLGLAIGFGLGSIWPQLKWLLAVLAAL